MRVCLLLILAVATTLGVWLSVQWLLPTHRIDDEHFAKLGLGMTQSEVEEILGVPAGDYRLIPQGSFHGGLGPGAAFGGTQEQKERKWWVGDSVWIQIGFGSDGRAVAGYSGTTIKTEPSFMARLRHWLGLR
jgi:hypothetical protein